MVHITEADKMGDIYINEGSFNHYLKGLESPAVNGRSNVDTKINVIILISEPFS
jgi:hypothetical protein